MCFKKIHYYEYKLKRNKRKKSQCLVRYETNSTGPNELDFTGDKRTHFINVCNHPIKLTGFKVNASRGIKSIKVFQGSALMGSSATKVYKDARSLNRDKRGTLTIKPNKDFLFQCVGSDKTPKRSKECKFYYSRVNW